MFIIKQPFLISKTNLKVLKKLTDKTDDFDSTIREKEKETNQTEKNYVRRTRRTTGQTPGKAAREQDKLVWWFSKDR